MSTQIAVNSKAPFINMTKENPEGQPNPAHRSVNLDKPEILSAKDLAGMVKILGDDLVYQKVMAQCTIDFRSHVRAKLESKSDGELTHTDAEVTGMDFSDWKPEARQRKTKEEKAVALLTGGDFTPDQIAAIIAKAGLDKGAKAAGKKA